MVQMAKYELFISYSNADHAWVEGYLLESLKQAGIYYYSEAAFALGTVKLLEFEKAIQQSQRTLLVLSPAYLANGFNQFVDLIAQSYGLDTETWPVIPLILQPIQLPPRLNMLVRLNATNQQEQEEAIRRLCADLKHSAPAPSLKPICPYPGILSFSEEMSDRFFGREQEVQELLERLSQHPFIAVIGSSASGKSSLVFAGLIPQLRRSGLFGSGTWIIRTMRPGETPLAALKTVLGSDDLKELAPAVTQVLASQPDAQRLLLVVDQFEEVFTLAGQESIPFQNILLRLSMLPNCYLILTVRADFYSDIIGSPLWQKIQSHRLEVVPLDQDGLRQAIIQPAENVGVFVEPALVDHLVTDAAGEPGVLPLIQETLVLLWERVERRFLPQRAYEALVLSRKADGDSDDKLTGLQVAIARRADAVLADLSAEQQAISAEQQAIARRIFMRLVQFGEGRADTRRQQSVDALRAAGEAPFLFDQTLKHLTNSRLLTLSGEQESSSTKVDIAHEALISGWPTLQQWIMKRREAEQTRRRLEARAHEWVRLGKGNGGLLDEVELAEAQRWLKSADASELGVDQVLPELVQTSEWAIQEAKRQEEFARQRELKQERKARKAAQVTIRVALIALVLVIGFSIFAGIQWDNSVKQRINSEKQSIIATSKYSGVLSSSHREFEALMASLEAGAKLQGISTIKNDPYLQSEVLPALQEAVYGVRERNRLQKHEDAVHSVSFSPDGKTLASGSADNTIKLWNLDGSLRNTLEDHKGIVYSVSFSPDGKILASGSADNTIKLWDQDGRLRNTLEEHKGAVHSVSFSPDGKTLASGSEDNTIKLWNYQDGTFLKTLPGHTGAVYGVSFSPDGKTLASASADNTIKLWNLDGGLPKTLAKNNRPVLSVSFSPDGQIIAATGEDGTIQFWNRDGKLLKRLYESSVVHHVIFSPDGKTIVSVGGDTTVKLWNPDGSTLQIFYGHKDGVYGVSFSPDGQKIASASADHTIKIWHRDSILLKTLQKHNDDAVGVAFSPDNQLIASVGADDTVQLWRRDGTFIKTLPGHTDLVHGVSFSPDSQTLATASWDKTIKLWSRDGALLKTLPGHSGRVYGVNFSPDGKMIVSASGDGTLKLWSRDGALLKTLTGHTDVVHNARFSPDGKIIASASHDKTVKLWNSDNGSLRETLKGHTNWIHDVSFSPDGQTIASASHDTTVKLWNLKGELQNTITGHSDKVLGVSFSPDGKIIASSGEDKTVRLWSLDSGTFVATLRGHGEWVHNVSFSPDNKTLASASYDNTVILWNLENLDNLDALLKRGCDWVRDDLKNHPTVAQSVTGVSTEESRRLCSQ
ncbi:eIF2A-related protein [Scytonema sp. PCC 10023]|uniref:nSTAND1 domain-containing NTPase n=1 Tax=Scytonema sp. PCC 10023 TaxID=1680591 RepID=UPI0039C726F7